MGVFSGFKRFFFLFGILAAFCCGGPDTRVYQGRGPAFDPTVYFRTGREGWFVFWDRNRTITQTGTVSRTCSADLCTDSYSYLYGGPAEARPFRWSLRYTIEGKTVIQIEDEGLRVEGQVTGSSLELRGHERVLRSPDKNVRTQSHINSLVGPGEMMVEERKFSYFGLEAGSILIRWQTGAH